MWYLWYRLMCTFFFFKFVLFLVLFVHIVDLVWPCISCCTGHSLSAAWCLRGFAGRWSLVVSLLTLSGCGRCSLVHEQASDGIRCANTELVFCRWQLAFLFLCVCVCEKWHPKKIQIHKRFKRMLISYDIDNTMQIFREIAFFRPQNDSETTVNRLKTVKNYMRGEVTYLFLLLCSVLAGRIFWQPRKKRKKKKAFVYNNYC